MDRGCIPVPAKSCRPAGSYVFSGQRTLVDVLGHPFGLSKQREIEKVDISATNANPGNHFETADVHPACGVAVSCFLSNVCIPFLAIRPKSM